MQLNPVKIGQITCLITALFAVSGCDQTEQLPVGSTIDVFPAQVTWMIEPSNVCDIENGPFNDQHVSISLKDSNELPLVDAPLTVSLDLSQSTSNGSAVLALYDDLNGDGRYQSSELVSTDKQSAYATHTDSVSGKKHLMIRVNLSCPYIGSLYTFSANVGTSLNISVTSSDVAETDEDVDGQSADTDEDQT